MTADGPPRVPDTSLDAVNRWMVAHHFHGYWMGATGGGGSQAKPCLWKWTDVRSGLLTTATLIGVGPMGLAEPRTLVLRNPEQRGVPSTMALNPRVLMPGEHTAARPASVNQALFVVEAEPGANLTAEGEAFPMLAGDALVIPEGTLHAYSNQSARPLVWLQGSDLALRALVGMIGSAPRSTDKPAQSGGSPSSLWPGGPRTADDLPSGPGRFEKPAGYFSAAYDRMKDPSGNAAFRPPMRYEWTETAATLVALKDQSAGLDRFDGIHLHYTSSLDRGPTLPTYSCEIQLLPPGLRTNAHRHNSTAIYAVVRGAGSTDVAGEGLQWVRGDIFCIPPWTWHHHENPHGEDAILYSVDDWPTMTKMGFYRVERDATT